MKILAIEFSSPARSVAVVEAGGRPVRVLGSAQSAWGDCDRQSSDALRLVDETLLAAGMEREGINCLAVGLGPGSYAGIRGAISLAQGWQLATGIRLVGVNSVDCIAAQAVAEGLAGRVEIVIDAQRQEFYLAGYELSIGGCRVLEPLRLASLADARRLERAGAVLVGPEARRWFSEGRVVQPMAATLGCLAAAKSGFVAGEELAPVYLRETQFVKAPTPRPLPRF